MNRIPFLAALALATAGLAQNITVAVNPHNQPIRIPHSGGHFSYTVETVNHETAPVEFQLWTVYRLPGGGEAGPVYGPEPLTLPADWSGASGQLFQFVPESMPGGDYRLIARVGVYPDSVWAADSFDFSKQEYIGGWYVQPSGAELALYDVSFPDADHGWATGFGIFHTADGGDNWFEQPEPEHNHRYGVHFIDSLTGWTAGDLTTNMLHTTDGGDNWVVQPTGYAGGYYFRSVFFVDADEGWAAGGFPRGINSPWRLIIHTTSGGDSWETQYLEQGYDGFNQVKFTDTEHGWAFGSGGTVFRTTNGGADWTQHVPGTSDYLEDVYFIDADTGWAVGGNNDLAVIIHTTDGGASWFFQDPGTDSLLWAVDFVNPEMGWAVGWDGVIVHTQTGGTVGLAGGRRTEQLPHGLFLEPAGPNPATRYPMLHFGLPRAGYVVLKAYNALGQVVATIVDAELEAGSHSARLDARSLPAGTYIVKLEAGGVTATRELVLAR